MTFVYPWELRARFAANLSAMYGREVPAYTTLLDAVRSVNRQVLDARGAAAERLGAIDRVSAERHGAIRVGTAAELRQVADVFAALGMHPVGFYDLRDARPVPVPVVSTAFRATGADELARNPFRVFVSVLTPDDRRFFTAELQAQVDAFLRARTIFPAELLELARRGTRDGGLHEPTAARFLELAQHSFALSDEPVDRAWYRTLNAVSTVAADIAGVTTTHINHLTPRVLDIDLLYDEMGRRGLRMIDEIQGPPAWAGPPVLLRQTSFRALDESRRMREPDGTVTTGSLRVRFGEVESRGLALSARGRDLFERASLAAEKRVADRGGLTREQRNVAAAEIWGETFPATEAALLDAGLAHFTFRPGPRARRGPVPVNVRAALDCGWLEAAPIVYEDFLPRSAAGIFQSNLTSHGDAGTEVEGSFRDRAWVETVLERPVHEPEHLYCRQQEDSLAEAVAAINLPVENP